MNEIQKHEYLIDRLAQNIKIAARLIGDSSEDNPEYTRGIIEFLMDSSGLGFDPDGDRDTIMKMIGGTQ